MQAIAEQFDVATILGAEIVGGIIAGYLVAWLGFGMVDFSSIGSAKFFQIPQIMHFGIRFDPASCVAIGLLYVLGGTTISVFASIAMTSIKLITTQEMSFRNTSIVGLAVALGVDITNVPETLATFPPFYTISSKEQIVIPSFVKVSRIFCTKARAFSPSP